MRVEEGEEPVVFYIKKCRQCHGSFEDEHKFQSFNYPEIYM